jgi:putative ABC transport system permease protein
MTSLVIILQIIGYLVLLASLFGLATMNERQKEIAVLRILAASPKLIVSLVILEALRISQNGKDSKIVSTFLPCTLILTAGVS